MLRGTGGVHKRLSGDIPKPPPTFHIHALSSLTWVTIVACGFLIIISQLLILGRISPGLAHATSVEATWAYSTECFVDGFSQTGEPGWANNPWRSSHLGGSPWSPCVARFNRLHPILGIQWACPLPVLPVSDGCPQPAGSCRCVSLRSLSVPRNCQEIRSQIGP